MSRILIIASGEDFCYQSLSYFDHILANGFSENGCEVVFTQPNIPLSDYFGTVDLVAGFNLKLNLQFEDGSYKYDGFGVPVVNFIVDHPYMHHMSLSAPLKIPMSYVWMISMWSS